MDDKDSPNLTSKLSLKVTGRSLKNVAQRLPQSILSQKSRTKVPVGIRVFSVRAKGKTLVLEIGHDITEHKKTDSLYGNRESG